MTCLKSESVALRILTRAYIFAAMAQSTLGRALDKLLCLSVNLPQRVPDVFLGSPSSVKFLECRRLSLSFPHKAGPIQFKNLREI